MKRRWKIKHELNESPNAMPCCSDAIFIRTICVTSSIFYIIVRLYINTYRKYMFTLFLSSLLFCQFMTIIKINQENQCQRSKSHCVYWYSVRAHGCDRKSISVCLHTSFPLTLLLGGAGVVDIVVIIGFIETRTLYKMFPFSIFFILSLSLCVCWHIHCRKKSMHFSRIIPLFSIKFTNTHSHT